MGCGGSKEAVKEEPQKKPVRKNRRGSLGAFTRSAYKEAQEKGGEAEPPPKAYRFKGAVVVDEAR